MSRQSWVMPFSHEPAAVYYVGACRVAKTRCKNDLYWFYSSIGGRRNRDLNPATMRPPAGRREGLVCLYPFAMPCRVAERG